MFSSEIINESDLYKDTKPTSNGSEKDDIVVVSSKDGNTLNSEPPKPTPAPTKK